MIDIQNISPDMAGNLICTAVLTMSLMKAVTGKALPPYDPAQIAQAMEKIEGAVIEVFGPDKGPVLLGAFAQEFTKSFKAMGAAQKQFMQEKANEVPDSKTE